MWGCGLKILSRQHHDQIWMLDAGVGPGNSDQLATTLTEKIRGDRQSGTSKLSDMQLREEPLEISELRAKNDMLLEENARLLA